MNERWQMNKLGFVNFWLYDWEEFLFRNGRLLLRGENGAGKSVTTQSFIPFMLDGDTRPYRLDSFGSKDRRMDYYLLGEDRDENTGYLYLEFIKPQLGLYRTLVVGLRARRGKPLDFWGFCLSDGRRIGTGENDFALFTQKGASQRISLTRQEAHNRFGDGENWVEKSSDYKRMVNRMFFGMERDQYNRLLNLLIQIRKPKLSKDFSPKLVCDILNDSLQPLSEDDIAPMVNSMEKMDDIQIRLRNLRSSLDAARRLRNEYIRYNSFVLGKKGQAYLKKHQEADRLSLDVQQREDEIDRLEESKRWAIQERTNAKQQFEEIQRQLDSLEGAEDLKVKTQRLEALCSQRKEDIAAVTRVKETEQRKQNELQAEERKKAQQVLQIQDREALLQKHLEELHELNAELQYPDHPQTLAQIDQAAREGNLAAFHDQLRKATRLLQQSEGVRQALDEALKKQDEARALLRQEQSELNNSEALVASMRDALCEAIAALEDPALPFYLTADDTRQLLHLVAEYTGRVQEQAMEQIFSRRLDALRRPLLDMIHSLHQALQQRQVELRELDTRKRELQAMQELPPSRSEAVESTRRYLQEQGIPHAAFYELVDFDPSLSPEQRALLEAQLKDAGLLDALVLAPEGMQQAATLFAQHPDHFLCLDAITPAEQLLPLHAEADAPAWAHVSDILQKISAHPQGEVYFTADGHYRQGALQGYSVPQEPASYIGATARRANRERQLAELEAQIVAKHQEVQVAAQQKKAAGDRMMQIEKAHQERPTAKDLAVALDLADKQREKVDHAAWKVDQCIDLVQQEQDKLSDLRSQFLPLAKHFPYEQTATVYSMMVDICQNYQNDYQELRYEHYQFEQEKSKLLQLEDSVGRLNDDLVDCNDHVRRAEAALRKTEAEVRSLQELLDQPEIKDLAQHVHQLTAALQQTEGLFHDMDKRVTQHQTDLDNKMPLWEQLKQQRLQAVLQDEHACQIFEEELRHGPGHNMPAKISLLEQAKAAWESVRQNDHNVTHESVRTSLEKNVNGATELTTYRLTLESIFDSEEGILRNRACVSLYPDGKKQDLLDFITSIENQIKADEQLLSAEDRQLFELILSQTITTKLRHRINDSQEWVERMSKIMQQLTTSMALHFALEWKGKPGDGVDELATRELVTLLRKGADILGEAEREKILNHFRARIQTARERAHREGEQSTYSELMRNALDFRSWFEFQLYYQKGEQTKKNLTNSAFNSFSGGEKAMAMYVPLFAALASQYGAASSDAPHLMALDEAFAGVDETNIESMFDLIHKLDLGYILNSQSLWGCYPTVDVLSITELWRPQDADVVTLMHYCWDGKVLHLEET